MAVRLRLRRVGKKKIPVYHIVAADSRVARTGKFLEIVGRYEPQQHPALIAVKEQRVFYWLKSGAVPTDTVRSLLQRIGVWLKWSMVKRGFEEGKIALEMEKWQMMQEGKRQREAERKARHAAHRKARKSSEGEISAAAPATAGAPAQA